MRAWLAAGKMPAAVLALLIAAAAPTTAQPQFPYDQEMLLDVRPLPGSKRVPILEIMSGGQASIDLWCHSGPGRAEISGDAITFTFGTMREEYCTPERRQRDEDLAAALTQVTQWRRKGDVIILTGATELRYRLSTH